MSNSATGLNNAWAIASSRPVLTDAEKADIRRRRAKDFEFMVLCESKRNMSMYRLLRDSGLDKYKELKL